MIPSDPDPSRRTVYHGGDLTGARRRFPEAPLPWIDLSTGISPLAYPPGEISDEDWTRLPGPDAVAALEALAATAYGAAAPLRVVAAPGTQALIQLVPRLAAARRVGVLGFTYGEYERVWREAGATVEIAEEPAALASCDVAVVVNPNNPDGRLVPVAALLELAAAMAAQGGLLVVDEAFMDLLGAEASLVPLLPAAGALVLRSFGKSYGLAGLRLGFAVAGRQLAGEVRRHLGPWAVSGPAIAIGRRALADRAWLEAAARDLTEAAARLDALLAGAGFRLVGGTPLYRLAAHDDAQEWFDRLGRAGILVRPFPARRRWLRFGIPGGEAAWRRLDAALASPLRAFP